MRLSLKQLKQLDVETISGDKLGHVFDLILEVNGQMVAQYIVKSSILSSKEYLVNRDQVIRFEEDKMIVEDGTAKGTPQERKKKSKPMPNPVAMRKLE